MPAARKNPGLQARLSQQSNTAPYPGPDQEMDHDVENASLQGDPVIPIQQLAEQLGGFEAARAYLNGADGQFRDPSFTMAPTFTTPPTFITPHRDPNSLAMPRALTFQDAANAILDDLDRIDTALQLPGGFAVPAPTFAPQHTFVHGHGAFRPNATPQMTRTQNLPAHTICPGPNVQIHVGSGNATAQRDQGNTSRGRQPGQFVPQLHHTIGAPAAFTAPPISAVQPVWGANNHAAANSMQVSAPMQGPGPVQGSNVAIPTATSTAGGASGSAIGTSFNATASQQNNQQVAVPAPPTIPAAPAAPATNPLRRTINASRGRVMAGSNGYADDLMNRPPYGARPPTAVALSPVEIMTFCPCWTYHPDVIIRLVKANFKREYLATIQLHATNNLDYDNMVRLRNRIQKHISVGGKLICGLVNEKWSSDELVNVAPYNNLTGDTWRTRHQLDNSYAAVQWADVKLVDIARPVINWPQGDDALLFTRCLRYALANPHKNYTTADCATIIREQGFVLPQTAGPFDHTYDARALARFEASGPGVPAETAEAATKRKVQQEKSKANARK